MCAERQALKTSRKSDSRKASTYSRKAQSEQFRFKRSESQDSDDEILAETAVSVLQKIQQRHAKMFLSRSSSLAREAQEDLVLLSCSSTGPKPNPQNPTTPSYESADIESDAEDTLDVDDDHPQTKPSREVSSGFSETDALALEICAQAELRLIWEDCKHGQKAPASKHHARKHAEKNA